jgi:hypothetical protein
MGHGELIGIFWKKKIRENLTTFVKKNSPTFGIQKTLRELVLNLELWLLENFRRTSKELNTEPIKKTYSEPSVLYLFYTNYHQFTNTKFQKRD